MEVVPLRSRDVGALIALLIGALVVGAGIAALVLAIVFGVGVAPEPSWNPWLIAIAVLAFVPAAMLSRDVWLVLRPAELAVGGDAITVTYPELLRAPLTVPLHAMRAALVGDRVDTALPRLVPPGAAPNLVLLFESTVAGALVRRSTDDGIYRGEHVAGLVLATTDHAAAERALAPWLRAHERYDEYLVNWNVHDGGRGRLMERRRALYLALTVVAVVRLVWLAFELL
jgi:hypothetical protein